VIAVVVAGAQKQRKDRLDTEEGEEEEEEEERDRWMMAILTSRALHRWLLRRVVAIVVVGW